MDSDGVVVYGLSAEEVYRALEKAYSDKTVKVAKSKIEKTTVKSLPPSEVLVAPIQYEAQLCLAQSQLKDRDAELADAEESAKKAISSIQTVHKQQQALFDEFVLLRQRYDEQKKNTVSILWNYCAKYHPDLRHIPPMEDPDTFVENEEVIGNLIVGEMLGEGQFATVKSCTMEGDADKEYALKIIKKDRITTFASLQRVANEIDNLRMLRTPYVVMVAEVIHTQSMLYIVTEKGGRDLFEFFDEHPDGVPENWARAIIANILKGVMFCHEHGICHRDLKPENILLSFDTTTETCIDLKLCDFGLSTRFKPKTALSDFCGSPGFFAPEMITQGVYQGDKVDVWSIGCILLELVLGHEKFCDVWMTAYDYEILQNKQRFTQAIGEAVDDLPSHLHFSDQLNEFVLQFLQLKFMSRPSVRQLAGHPWLDGLLDEELTVPRPSRGLSGAWSPVLSPNGSFTMDEGTMSGRRDSTHAREALREAFSNLSEKERRQMEEYVNSHQNDAAGMHLPPIIPSTPSIGTAKKLLRGLSDSSHGQGHFGGGHSSYHSPPPHHHSVGEMSPTPNNHHISLPTLDEDAPSMDYIRLPGESVSNPSTPFLEVPKPRLIESQSVNNVNFME